MNSKSLALALSVVTVCVVPPSVARSPAQAQTRLAAARSRAANAVAGFERFAADYRRAEEAFDTGASANGSADAYASRSPAALAAEERRLRDALLTLERTRTWLLPARLKAEHASLAAHARLRSIELRERDVWRREPHRYAQMIAADADRTLRDPALAPDLKLRRFLDHSRAAERLLDDARLNLAAGSATNRPAAPRLFVEAGIADARLAARFFREDVLQLFERAGGSSLSAARRAEMDEARRAVAGELREFAEWLERELLPRAPADDAARLGVGADVLRRMLRLTDATDVTGATGASFDELARRAGAELRSVQDSMRGVAEEVAPGQPVAGALQTLRRERPTAAGLAGDARLELNRLQVFLRTDGAFALPARPEFEVAETPLYLRAHDLAFVEAAPGDGGTARARLLVTPPDPGENRRAQDEQLAYFNRYALAFLTAHHATPGGLAVLRRASATDDGEPPTLLAAGWGDYCEEALLDAGFGGNNPRYRLAQLQRRAASLSRHLVALELHGGRMSIDEAVQFFEREAYVEPACARLFARQVALDPFALLPALGYRELIRLRDEARRREGADFRLRRFHDAVLAFCDQPLAVARDRVLAASGGEAGAGDPATDGGRQNTPGDPNAQSGAGGARQELDFTVLAMSTMSDYEGGRALRLVTDADEFRRLWREANASGDPPAINFATRSVIFVRQGQRPTGGYGISVRSVRRTGAAVEVEAVETRPAPGDFTTQVITSPFVVISVPRLDAGTIIRFADAGATRGESPETSTGAATPKRAAPKPATPKRTAPKSTTKKGTATKTTTKKSSTPKGARERQTPKRGRP